MSPVPAERVHDRRLSPLVWSVAAYALLAIWITCPLVGHLATSLTPDAVDPGLNAWVLWWDAQRLPFSTAWWNAPFFYPLQGAMALSEHLVGASVVTTPMFWLGATPVLAYNLALLLSFVLSALCAALLVLRLTHRHDAAFLAGLLFGFAPYRIAQLAHLQVLVSWWMPLALLGLHGYVTDGRRRWLALFAASWLLQGLSNGYYLFFFSVLAVLWLVWFVPLSARRTWATILGAWAIAALPLVPVLLTFARVQHREGLARSFGETISYGARLNAALFASPQLAWSRWLPEGPGENQLFPGISLALVVIIGVLAARRRVVPETSVAWRRIRWPLIGSAAVLAAVAASTRLGAWRLAVGPLAVSVSRFDKPLGVGLVLAAVAVLMSPRVRDAFRRRSVFAFYVIAAGILGILSLGPMPQLGDTVVWYRAPYSWLLYLPGFSGLRVPARFAMPALLCLSVIAGLTFARLVRRDNRWRAALAVLLTLGIVADTWTRPLHLAPAATALALPAGVPSDAVVIELPLGDSNTDVGAMLHMPGHGHALVNGYSGYAPNHFFALVFGLRAGDHETLHALSMLAPVAVTIVRDRDPDGRWGAFMREQPATHLVASDRTRDTYLVAKSQPVPEPAEGPRLRVRMASATVHAETATLAIDGRPDTSWQGSWRDAGSEAFTLDLGDPQVIGGVTLTLRAGLGDIPRSVVLETSGDAADWVPAWQGLVAGRYFLATIARPTTPSLHFAFAPVTGRYLRIRVGRNSASPWTWAIAEVSVHGPAR